MTTSKLRALLLLVVFALLAFCGSGPTGRAWGDEPSNPPGERADVESVIDDEGVDPPPGDPWYAPPPQQRGSRPNPADRLVFKMRITPHWFDANSRFWYRNDLPGGDREFILVNAERGTRAPAFDHQKLAASLSKAVGGAGYQGKRLPFDEIEFVDGSTAVRFNCDKATWKCSLDDYTCSKTEPGQAKPDTSSPADNETTPRRGRPAGERQGPDAPGSRQGLRSQDGKWTAFVKDRNVVVRAEGKSEEVPLTTDGKEGLAYGRLSWAPDSKTLVAFRIEPGERKEVYLIQSSPPGGGRARFRPRPYALPGDRFTAYELNLIDVATKKSTRPIVDRIDFGSPDLHWDKDGRHFTYEKNDRGHQRFRLIRVDSHTGEAHNLIDEKTETFIWTAHREGLGLRTVNWLDQSDDLIYVSERSGWRHLYLIDAKTGTVKNPITQGEYVVRGVDQIDEAKRQVWFRAGGKNPDQDPYFLHHYRVNFDGTGLVALTEGNGNHRTVQFSPDRRYLIDTYSRVDMAPIHELRRTSDGKLVCNLEEADINALKANGWAPPEVFVAKGRDGKTDIWGIISRPKGFDPNRKYPVIEDIYAGPHGSFVPKDFSPGRRSAALNDLGFIVVQMDGMGTANRSKAFHDVCWHNIKDAGFADRILWHQAVARKYAYYDLTRVGIYGTSAGGQNSTAAMLFHPEFYKAAVSACGCHDNRMDKASWNEQWMGYPVGPWYSESSNIDNAKNLRGKLLLIVGEMDTNVPPESTMRLVDALIKANKDFELLVVPNANHGMGGEYGVRRMRDFFVRHLLGGESKAPLPGPRRDEYTTRAASGNGNGKPSTLCECITRPGRAQWRSERAPRGDRALRGRPRQLAAIRAAPGSPHRDERIHDFTAQWLDQLGSVDFDRLGQDGKVDYLLLKNHLAHELRQIEIRTRERNEWEPMVPFARPILDLDEARRALKPMAWSTVAGDLTRLAKEIATARRALEQTGPGRDRALAKVRSANRGLAAVEGLRNTLRTWFAFYDGYDPLFSWWMQEPYKAVDQAVQDYAGALRQRYGASADGSGSAFGPGAGRRRGGGGGGFGGDGPGTGGAGVVRAVPDAPGRLGKARPPPRSLIGTARSWVRPSAATPCSAS